MKIDAGAYFEAFVFNEKRDLFNLDSQIGKTIVDYLMIDGRRYPRFTNEFWTSGQRQAAALHEIAYRACFKPQLPRFLIELLTQESDVVFDPFAGRGTTVIEAGLLKRNVISNDTNPLSEILCRPRFFIPKLNDLETRLDQIPIDTKTSADIDLSMFYHPQTESEIISLRCYLSQRQESGEEDYLDSWIRMVATNRLTGHSPGFFSVYTLPPNQAVLPDSQIRINEKRKQKPEYRNTKRLVMKKSRSLMARLTERQKQNLKEIGMRALFISRDARYCPEIIDSSVNLTVTSPPFLDVVHYSHDNWLRCWFNSINPDEITSRVTMSKTVDEWCSVVAGVFEELYRITKINGWVAFEVGEVRNGRVKLDEYVVPLGVRAGFECKGILINKQQFTKTANIWGINNNSAGTNTNRIVIFYKARKIY